MAHCRLPDRSSPRRCRGSVCMCLCWIRRLRVRRRRRRRRCWRRCPGSCWPIRGTLKNRRDTRFVSSSGGARDDERRVHRHEPDGQRRCCTSARRSRRPISPAGVTAGKVVIIRRDPQQYAMAFVADWSPDHHVTQQEHHVAHVAADILESWVRRLVRQSPRAGDRRAARRGFDEVLERLARDAVQGGIPVTAVVISFGDAAFRPDVTQARVASLREHLRGGDLVGRLGEGDVGVLLHDTGAAQAERARLDGCVGCWSAKECRCRRSAIGMATRRPGEPITGALAQEARQRARYHASDN